MNRPLVDGIDYTLEDGKMVFTVAFLLRRGFCCNSGCRNCPYRADAAAAPRVSFVDASSLPVDDDD